MDAVTLVYVESISGELVGKRCQDIARLLRLAIVDRGNCHHHASERCEVVPLRGSDPEQPNTLCAAGAGARKAEYPAQRFFHYPSSLVCMSCRINPQSHRLPALARLGLDNS